MRPHPLRLLEGVEGNTRDHEKSVENHIDSGKDRIIAQYRILQTEERVTDQSDRRTWNGQALKKVGTHAVDISIKASQAQGPAKKINKSGYNSHPAQLIERMQIDNKCWGHAEANHVTHGIKLLAKRRLSASETRHPTVHRIKDSAQK